MFRRLVVVAMLAVTLFMVAQKKDANSGPAPVKGGLKAARGGLYYSDLVEGTGKLTEKGKRVTVHYTGWLENGNKFDSSVGHRPFSFVLGAGDVIRGWDVGVEGMRVGGMRQLHISYAMAYGANGMPPVIPPYAKLIFEVE